ncbi:MAG: hypothetical protein QG649_438, partial [Patescibacteria group bacterium]|nr:hypothetical protein [Patescibacteria group bacterium]
NQVSTLANQVESKDGQISRLTSQLTEVKKDAQRVKSDEVTTDTANQGSDAIIKAALKYSRAKVANRGYPAGATDLTAEIDKQTAQFARVQVGSATAGPGLDIVYFKKDGADWMLLGGDNGDPTRFRQTFGMPSDF